jgi:hypothetical protein
MRGCVIALFSLGVVLLSFSAPARPSHVQAVAEKDARTPAQQKIESRLLYEIYRTRGQSDAKQVPPGPTGVRIDKHGRALVDIRAVVTPALIARVKKSGGTILSTSVEHHSILAHVPVLQLERLAGDRSVRAISVASEPVTVRQR